MSDEANVNDSETQNGENATVATVTKTKPKKTAKPAAKPVAAAKPAKKAASKGGDSILSAIAAIFSLGSDLNRLKTIVSLGEETKFVGQLCEEMGLSQPALSHHLALLRHSGLIVPVRDGKHNYYELTEKGEILKATVATLEEELSK